MAGAETAHAVPGEGKNYARRFDSVAPHQHGTVVKGGVSGEQVEHQLATQHSTNGDAGIEKVLRPQVAA